MYTGLRNSTLSLSSLFIKQNKQNVFLKRVQTQMRFSKVTSDHFQFIPSKDTKNSKYMEKYYDKLKIKAEKENFSSVEEMKAERLKAIQKNSFFVPKKISSTESETNSSNKKNSTEATMNPPPNVKTLDKILNMEKIKDHDSETIEKIWLEYHSTKNCLSAVIPAETYRTLFKRGQQYPMFVVPLPQEHGLEFYILQFQFHQCFFTSLLEYKTHGIESKHHMVLTHFPELMDFKGIVLMHGEIIQPKLISLKSAQYLAYAMQKFYVSGTNDELNLVEKFHKYPDKFEYKDLIKNL
ncbi:ATP11-domain-containing protein [Rhizophagus irregularis]|uniref:ATP11-domain-containing protein n=1 Tax=Rhizophagus irregularis TaxID=588596 RepID=A0A2I1FVJ2_9GLOM|nr:ATP11-domain-containing protein [Rhizophagus irregularis]